MTRKRYELIRDSRGVPVAQYENVAGEPEEVKGSDGASWVQGVLKTQTATIEAAAELSSPIAIGGASLIHIYMPAAFTGTSIKFDSSATLTGTYQPVRDSNGVEVQITVAQGINTAVTGTPLEALAGCNFVKLRVSAQAEAREVIVSAKG